MAGLKAVFLKKLSMTAYAMGRYAITRRKIRAGAVVPRIHAAPLGGGAHCRRPLTMPSPLTLPSPPRGGRGREGTTSIARSTVLSHASRGPGPGAEHNSRLYHVGGGVGDHGGRGRGRLLFRSTARAPGAGTLAGRHCRRDYYYSP